MAGHSDTFHHVRDFPYFEVPQFLGGEIPLPVIPFLPSPSKVILWWKDELPFGETIWGVQLTKFMVLQLVAFAFVLWIARGLSQRTRGGQAISGRWWNFWETLALYIRDNVVRPTIGTGHHGHEHDDAGHHGHEHSPAEVTSGHPADKYLPFVWSCFFYVLICNLLGAIPWLGSPTGEINVTGMLAVCALGATVIYGSKELGFGGFWKSLCPSMDVPGAIKPLLLIMIWCIELLGLFIKHAVLAVRLFANIMAGHTVIAMFLGFIAAPGIIDSALFYVVTPASILGQVGMGMLELFVAFLQAYIFAFLATLFIGTAVHPH